MKGKWNITFLKGQNYSDGEHMCGCQGLGLGEAGCPQDTFFAVAEQFCILIVVGIA